MGASLYRALLFLLLLLSLLQVAVSGQSPSFTGSALPTTFAYPDLKGTEWLAITPSGGFTGQVAITFDRNIAGGPVGYSALPATAQVTAPGSPVTLSSAKTFNTPLNFTWSSWPIGHYEVIAVLTSGSLVQRVRVYVHIKSSLCNVLTWHNDAMRTGANPIETVLTPSNVTSPTFGKLFEHLTNGAMEAQPLFVPSVYVNGAYHNVIYEATSNCLVYAFDADNVTGANAAPLWTTDVGPFAPAGTGGGGDNYNQGVIGTPAIDLSSNTIYVLSKNYKNGVAYNQLHALDLGTGHEKLGGPVNVTATITGTIGGVGGSVVFQPAQQYQRCGLLLLHGVVYVAFGGLLGDPAPCRGWLMGYSMSNLQLVRAFTTAPDAGVGSQTAFAGGAIWMSGAGPSSDGTYIYVATGNGDFNADQANGHDYSDSTIKLQPNGTSFTVTDYFTPSNQLYLDNHDLDLGSSNPMVVPQFSSTPLILQLSKSGEVYVLNRSFMGGFGATDHVVQEFAGNAGGFHCTPAYFSQAVYFASDGGPMNAYRISNTGLAASPFGTTATSFDRASPSISYNRTLANPNTSAIVWIVEHGSNAILHAYSATTLAPLYSSASLAQDAAGPYIKFGVPTVANGKVYVPCEDRLVVYGLH